MFNIILFFLFICIIKNLDIYDLRGLDLDIEDAQNIFELSIKLTEFIFD